MQRILNAIRDVFDPRDKIASPAPTSNTSVDLGQWLPAVRDQGQEGCCTMFAGSGIMEWNYNRFKKQNLVLSPQFGYRAERIIEGDIAVDGGAQARTMMKVLTTYGLCLETSDPYTDTGWKNPTTLAQLAEARNYRLNAYHRILDLPTLKSVLASGYVASMSIEVYESFQMDSVMATGIVPVPEKGERLDGGHEVYCYGFNDGLKTNNGIGGMLMRNSWGKDWGIDGNFVLPYDFWPYVNDSWTAHLGAPWKPTNIALQ